VTDPSPSQLQVWIAGLNAGDPAARDALLTHAYDRLRRLTRKLLQDFGRLRRWEDADDVLHGALERLLRALDRVPLASVANFFRLATQEIRRELLDLTRHHFGPEGTAAHHASAAPAGADATPPPGGDAPQSTNDPGRLALWTELHRRVEALPAEQRDVFELRWYQGLSVEEAAAVLGLSAPTVKRRWREARLTLAAFLEGGGPGP
jgi:RNA polymerase sigma-70 factor (ECF subfamily)